MRLKFLVVLLVVFGSLLLSTVPVLAALQNDGYPHYGKDGACNDHVSNPERLGSATPQTFTLCQGSSGATSWFAAVYKVGASTPSCTYGSQSSPYTASSPQSFNPPCSLGTGTYKAYIYFWVGNSQMMTHCDQYFTVP